MQRPIRGKDVREIREALRLTVGQFALVLGVHPSSIHRWESSAAAEPKIEGVAKAVLVALHERSLAGSAAKRRAALKGQEISNTLAVGGLLLALGLLIAFAASDD